MIDLFWIKAPYNCEILTLSVINCFGAFGASSRPERHSRGKIANIHRKIDKVKTSFSRFSKKLLSGDLDRRWRSIFYLRTARSRHFLVFAYLPTFLRYKNKCFSNFPCLLKLWENIDKKCVYKKITNEKNIHHDDRCCEDCCNSYLLCIILLCI